MKLTAALLLWSAAPILAQTPAPPAGGTIAVTIAYPGPAILRSTYGIQSVPKGYVLAQVTAVNHTAQQIDIGEGDVIQIFREHGLEAWPARNGAALLNAQQGHTTKAQIFKWTSVALVIGGEAVLSGIGNLGPVAQKKAALGISLGASIAQNLSAATGAVPANTYSSDGMQPTEQIPAHQSITRLVLMTVPGAGAVTGFEVQVR